MNPPRIYGPIVAPPLFTDNQYTLFAGSAANVACVVAISSAQRIGSSFDGPVRAVADLGGDLIVGGDFRFVDGVETHYIARWDGHSWRPLGAGVDGPVNALTVYQDHLIAGGTFANSGSSPAHGVARWDGNEWNSLGTGFDLTYPGDGVNVPVPTRRYETLPPWGSICTPGATSMTPA